MHLGKIKQYRDLYRQSLLEEVIPFWEQYSVDWERGGYFTSLYQNGKVYDTDKFMWLQARQVWTFSMLYNRVEKKERWLKIAENGIKFLREHGRDPDGHFYFSLTREGKPLTHAFNIYTDCFAALAFGEYGRATGALESFEIARKTYQLFLQRCTNPKGRYEKSTGVRPLKSFGLSMMTAYLSYELEGIIDSQESLVTFEDCIHQILEVAYNPQTGYIHEHYGSDGEFLDTFEGRLINPGHGIEAMWFLMDIGEKLDRPSLIERAADLSLQILNYGWDKSFGGIFYFLDAKGAPLQQLEWDQKLWWVHQEALIALSRAYLHTGREDIWEGYELVHQYTWQHFPDAVHGEWFGYLHRDGTCQTLLKGGKWKGCFHTPRALYECWQTFEKLLIQKV